MHTAVTHAPHERYGHSRGNARSAAQGRAGDFKNKTGDTETLPDDCTELHEVSVRTAELLRAVFEQLQHRDLGGNLSG